MRAVPIRKDDEVSIVRGNFKVRDSCQLLLLTPAVRPLLQLLRVRRCLPRLADGMVAYQG